MALESSDHAWEGLTPADLPVSATGGVAPEAMDDRHERVLRALARRLMPGLRRQRRSLRSFQHASLGLEFGQRVSSHDTVALLFERPSALALLAAGLMAKAAGVTSIILAVPDLDGPLSPSPSEGPAFPCFSESANSSKPLIEAPPPRPSGRGGRGVRSEPLSSSDGREARSTPSTPACAAAARLAGARLLTWDPRSMSALDAAASFLRGGIDRLIFLGESRPTSEIWGNPRVLCLAGEKSVVAVDLGAGRTEEIAADLLSAREAHPGVKIKIFGLAGARERLEALVRAVCASAPNGASPDFQNQVELGVFEEFRELRTAVDRLGPALLLVFGPEAARLKSQFRRFGSLFLGRFTAEPLGRALGGGFPFLPPDGAARGPLSPLDFCALRPWQRHERRGFSVHRRDLIALLPEAARRALELRPRGPAADLNLPEASSAKAETEGSP